MMVTVPAGLVDDVRNGLYFVVDDVGGELFYAGEKPRLERDPAQYAAIFERLDRARTLLHMTGWSRVDTPTEIRVDLDEYGAVLQRALECLLRVERDVFREIDRADAGRARRGEAPIREAVAARLDALEPFLATVEGRG